MQTFTVRIGLNHLLSGLYVPTKYLLLIVLLAILAASQSCTNVTETPPAYVISTPRIPRTVIADATQTLTLSSALSSPTPITIISPIQGTQTPEIHLQALPHFADLTPKEILESELFDSNSITRSTEPVRGGQLRIAATFDIPTLDPRQTATGGTMVLANFVYEGFVRYDQSIDRDPISPAILPALAHQWDFRNQGTELVLKLNSGIHWGDIENPRELGPEITASDYLYTLSSYKDNSSFHEFYESLKSIEVQNRYTLKLKFSRPAFWIIPFFASSMGIQFNPFLADAGRLNDSMIGPGPFILDSYESETQVTFVRNPHYFRKDYRGRSLPYLGSVQFIYAGDRNTRLALLKTSKVHMAELALTPKEIDTELAIDPDLNISIEIPTGIQNSIALQLDNLNWATRGARRAVALVTDGKRISETIFEGYGMPTDKFEWWYWNEVLPSWGDDLDYMYGKYNNHTDVARAQELWEIDGMGDLNMKLNYYRHSSVFNEVVAAIQQDWKKLGITLQPVPLTYPEYVTALHQRTSVDAILATQSFATDMRSAAYTRVHSNGIDNREGINDPLVDTLVTQLEIQGDQAATLRQLRNRLNDQVYWVSLPSIAFISETIFRTGIHGIPNGNHSSFRSFYQGKVLAQAWMD